MASIRPTQAVPGNVSSTALSGGATYTGTWASVIGYDSVTIACKADVAGTLYADFADSDGGTTQSTLTFVLAASVNEVHRLTITRPFFRVRLVNGSSAQSTLSLYCMMGQQNLLTAPLNLSLGQDSDAVAVRAIDAEYDIAEGKRSGYSIINKFGRNADVDTGTVPEDVWDGGGVYTGFPSTSGELVTVVSSSANDAAAGSGARTITIYGLDADYAAQSETITLNGTTKVDSVGTYVRVHRAIVQTSGNSNMAFNAGTLTIQHKVTTANIFAVIAVGVNQTEVCTYTIPAGYTGYVRYIECMLDRATSATAQGAFYIREYDKAPRLVKSFSLSDSDEHMQTIYGGLVLPAKTDIALRITQVSANNAVIYGHFDIIQVKD